MSSFGAGSIPFPRYCYWSTIVFALRLLLLWSSSLSLPLTLSLYPYANFIRWNKEDNWGHEVPLEQAKRRGVWLVLRRPVKNRSDSNPLEIFGFWTQSSRPKPEKSVNFFIFTFLKLFPLSNTRNYCIKSFGEVYIIITSFAKLNNSMHSFSNLSP